MRFVYFIPTLMLLSFVSFAQNDTRTKLFFNLENGLPSNHVYCVIEDKDGYFWFMTDNGMVKYNGYSFKRFTTNEGLPSNDIWQFLEDEKGRKWLQGYSKEIGYLKDDEYHVAFLNNENTVRLLEILDTNNLTLVAFSSGDKKINIGFFGDEHKQYMYTIAEPGAVWLNKKMSLFCYGTENKVKKISFSKGRYIITSLPRLPNNPVLFGFRKAMVNHSEKAVIYHANGSEIFFYNIKNAELNRFPLKQYSGIDDEIFTLERKDSSFVCFGKQATYTFSDEMSLNELNYTKDIIGEGVQITNNCVDKTGNKWYSTTSNGALFVPRQVILFNEVKPLSGKANLVFMGSMSNGYTYWWDKNTNNLIAIDTNYQVKVNSVFKNNVLAIAEQPGSQNIYLCFNNSLMVYNQALGSVRDYTQGKVLHVKGINTAEWKNIMSFTYDDASGIISDNHKSYCFGGLYFADVDSQGNMVTARFGGVSNVILKADTIIATDFLAERYTKFLHEKYTNQYLLYSNHAFAIANHTTGNYKNIGSGLLKALGYTNIVKIIEDKYYNIYVQTDKTISVVNIKNRTINNVRVNVNLTDAHIAIYKNYLFVAGEFGIQYARINGESDLGRFYTSPKIIKSYYNKLNDFAIDISGKLYLNTDKGVYSYTAGELISSGDAQAVGTPFIKLTVQYPKIKLLNELDSIQLPIGQNRILLDMINVYGKGERYFQYRIIGYTDWTGRRSGELFLSDLVADNYYRIELKANDDIWKTNVYTLYLYKVPQWWQTKEWKVVFWVTGILMVVFVVIGTVVITRYYVNKSNEKKSRLLDLELRALYSQINPHFIFNTLSSAQYFIDKKDYNEAYTHVNKFSKLLRSYLKSSQERYVTLADEIAMLKSYIELQQTRFENSFNYTIEVDNKIAVDSVKIPSLLIQPLVENAINHGFFHKKDAGNLWLRFEQGVNSEEIICTIEDDGVGRIKAEEIKRESAARDSYGTKLTKKLIDIFKEYEGMDIFLEYIDKEAPLTGTIVKLTIKNLKYET